MYVLHTSSRPRWIRSRRWRRVLARLVTLSLVQRRPLLRWRLIRRCGFLVLLLFGRSLLIVPPWRPRRARRRPARLPRLVLRIRRAHGSWWRPRGIGCLPPPPAITPPDEERQQAQDEQAADRRARNLAGTQPAAGRRRGHAQLHAARTPRRDCHWGRGGLLPLGVHDLDVHRPRGRAHRELARAGRNVRRHEETPAGEHAAGHIEDVAGVRVRRRSGCVQVKWGVRAHKVDGQRPALRDGGVARHPDDETERVGGCVSAVVAILSSLPPVDMASCAMLMLHRVEPGSMLLKRHLAVPWQRDPPLLEFHGPCACGAR